MRGDRRVLGRHAYFQDPAGSRWSGTATDPELSVLVDRRLLA